MCYPTHVLRMKISSYTMRFYNEVLFLTKERDNSPQKLKKSGNTNFVNTFLAWSNWDRFKRSAVQFRSSVALCRRWAEVNYIQLSGREMSLRVSPDSSLLRWFAGTDVHWVNTYKSEMKSTRASSIDHTAEPTSDNIRWSSGFVSRVSSTGEKKKQQHSPPRLSSSCRRC